MHYCSDVRETVIFFCVGVGRSGGSGRMGRGLTDSHDWAWAERQAHGAERYQRARAQVGFAGARVGPRGKPTRRRNKVPHGSPSSSPPGLRRIVHAQFSAPYTTHATKTIKIIEISKSHLLIYPTTPSNQEWPSPTDVCKRYGESLRIRYHSHPFLRAHMNRVLTPLSVRQR